MRDSPPGFQMRQMLQLACCHAAGQQQPCLPGLRALLSNLPYSHQSSLRLVVKRWLPLPLPAFGPPQPQQRSPPSLHRRAGRRKPEQLG